MTSDWNLKFHGISLPFFTGGRGVVRTVGLKFSSIIEITVLNIPTVMLPGTTGYKSNSFTPLPQPVYITK